MATFFGEDDRLIYECDNCSNRAEVPEVGDSWSRLPDGWLMQETSSGYGELETAHACSEHCALELDAKRKEAGR